MARRHFDRAVLPSEADDSISPSSAAPGGAPRRPPRVLRSGAPGAKNPRWLHHAVEHLQHASTRRHRRGDPWALQEIRERGERGRPRADVAAPALALEGGRGRVIDPSEGSRLDLNRGGPSAGALRGYTPSRRRAQAAPVLQFLGRAERKVELPWAACSLTARRGDATESATENKPPGSFGGPVRVKRCGKSAPLRRRRRRHGKPHAEQDQIGKSAAGCPSRISKGFGRRGSSSG